MLYKAFVGVKTIALTNAETYPSLTHTTKGGVNTSDHQLLSSELSQMSWLLTLPRGRDSVFSAGSEQYRGDTNAVCPPNLRECVLAMEDCCEEVRVRTAPIFTVV